MKGLKQYVLDILKDHRGDPSSARWLAFLAFFALVALIWIGIDTDPKQHTLILGMANLLCWVVIGCVAASQGASGADALGKKKTSEAPGSSAPLPDAPQSHASQKEASAA